MQKSRVFYYASSNFQFPISNFYDKDFNGFGATHILVFYDSDEPPKQQAGGWSAPGLCFVLMDCQIVSLRWLGRCS